MAAPMMWEGVMTRLMACPPTCGAAAAVICSEAYAKKHGLNRQVRIAAQAMTTDFPSTFEAHDMMRVVGYDMAKEAGRKVYEAAGIGPKDIDVVELHDCFAQNELITYESLGLCPEGGAEKFVRDGDNTYGGKVVTNPSGGLLSKGHPLGATGAIRDSPPRGGPPGRGRGPGLDLELDDRGELPLLGRHRNSLFRGCAPRPWRPRSAAPRWRRGPARPRRSATGRSLRR